MLGVILEDTSREYHSLETALCNILNFLVTS